MNTPKSFLPRRCAVLLLFFASSLSTWAKDAPLAAIFLLDGPDGPAYAQVTGILINGKTELRACGNGLAGPIDKSTYKGLAKINLLTVHSLERLPDGQMAAVIAVGTPAICVLPGNFKYEKEAAPPVADLVDKSIFGGQVVGSSATGLTTLPPFSRGTKLVFVNEPTKEEAEFLRAAHASSVPLLKSYLSAYAGASHDPQARLQLAGLLGAEGTAHLATYKKSSGGPSPDFPALKVAHEDASGALSVIAEDATALSLRASIEAELKELVQRATTDLSAYKSALAAHTPGYGKMVEGTELSNAVILIDPQFGPGRMLQIEVLSQNHQLETALQAAQTQMKADQYPQALTLLAGYEAFAIENAEIGRMMATIYQHYLSAGDEAAANNRWSEAVSSLEQAVAVSGTLQAKEKLTKARAGLVEASDKATSALALSHSQEYLAANDPIRAYEVLADLPDAQRALVAEPMATLEMAYLQAATARAKQLQQTHTPIHGRADEDSMRQAYEYYQRASKLSEDDDIKVKMELLAGEISLYYVGLGRRYMEKPLSSEVGVGWAFMAEALHYRNNLDEVRDEMTKNSAAYQMRARLSIGVVFRDQTSRRDSAGFTDQMQQAFATGLETSGLPVKVILPGGHGALEPNFQFIGEILQHRTIRTPKKTTLRSEYRSGSREIPNEEWNKADLINEGAALDLQRAQAALASAQTRNNKKQIEQDAKALSEAETKAQSARAKMNALPKTIGEPVLSPYSYTQTTLELTNIVELSFRIVDEAGNTIQGPTRVVKGEVPQTFVLLDNIKSDDTKGLKEADSSPDETQLMTDVEIEARDMMVKLAREKVLELPSKVLEQARVHAKSGDADAAAELYVLYLNSTPALETAERQEASGFLNENFNIRHGSTLSASLQ